jgi:hypothetical protein
LSILLKFALLIVESPWIIKVNRNFLVDFQHCRYNFIALNSRLVVQNIKHFELTSLAHLNVFSLEHLTHLGSLRNILVLIRVICGDLELLAWSFRGKLGSTLLQTNLADIKHLRILSQWLDCLGCFLYARLVRQLLTIQNDRRLQCFNFFFALDRF